MARKNNSSQWSDPNDISKSLAGIMRDLSSTSRLLDNVTEQLSKAGFNELLANSKDLLKSTGLLSNKQLEAVKDVTSLKAVLGDLEAKYQMITKLETGRQQGLENEIQIIKRSGKSRLEQASEIEEATKKHLLAQAKAKGMQEDVFNAIYAGLPSLHGLFEQTQRNSGAFNKLEKHTDKLTDGIKNQIKSFFTLDNATALAKKAITRSYDEMTRMTSKGMLGAFGEINLISKKLLMSTEDFENAIQNNRGFINALGGGIEGIRTFGDQVDGIQKDLMYLGKNAAPAAIKLAELSYRTGIYGQDQKDFSANTKSATAQFKKFNAMFGDSIDQYTDLMLSQQQEEHVQSRLNLLKGHDLIASQEELRVRTENLKMLGLSNDQIKDFNTKLENIYDPKKSNFEQQASEAVYLKASIADMTRLLGGRQGGDENSQRQRELAANLEKYQGIFDKIADMNVRASPEERQKYMAQPEVLEAMKALNNARTEVTQKFGPTQNITSLITGERSGSLLNFLDTKGQELNTAQHQGLNQFGKTNDEKKQLNDRVTELRGEVDKNGNKTEIVKSLEAETIAVQTVTNMLKDPFVNALGAAVAGLGAVTGATTLFSAALGKAALGKGLLGSAGKFGTRIMKVAPAAGVATAALGAYDAYKTYGNYQDNKITERQRNEEYGHAGGGAIGSIVGGTLGSFLLPGIGTVAGGLAGGWLGDIAGGWIGSKFGKDNTLSQSMLPDQGASGKQAAKSSLPITQAQPPNLSQKGQANWRKGILEKEMSNSNITDTTERAAFMAQMDHESQGFSHMSEVGKNAGQQYEGRKDLGNINRGDGQRYKGRGYIQLTGRDNYKKYGDMIGVDLINNPDLAAVPDIAAKVAVAYWNTKKIGNQTLSQQAKAGNFDMVTKGINGGFNGKADRDMKYNSYLAAYTENGGQDLTNGINSPLPTSKLPTGTVPTQQVSMLQSQASTVTQPGVKNSVNPDVIASTLASTATNAQQSPIIVQLDKLTIDKLAEIYTFKESPTIIPTKKQDEMTMTQPSIDTALESLSGKTADTIFNSLVSNIAQSNLPQVKKLDSSDVVSQANVMKEPTDKDEVAPLPVSFKPETDQVNELKKQTELLAMIVKNTTVTRTANQNAYQRDRSTVLNGLS